MSFAALMFAVFLIPAFALYRELSRPADIWWTPVLLMVPVTDAADRVEVYVRGKPLVALLKAGQLRVMDDASGSVLATSDVGFRFNNWDRVRAQRIPTLLGYAAMCGVTATLFLVIVTGRLAYRGEKEAVAA
jgi:predicted xylose isomerase-like sugar epimerase